MSTTDLEQIISDDSRWGPQTEREIKRGCLDSLITSWEKLPDSEVKAVLGYLILHKCYFTIKGYIFEEDNITFSFTTINDRKEKQ